MGTAQTAPTRRRVTQAATEGHARRLPAVPGTAQSGRLRGGGRRTGGWRWGRAAGCAGLRDARGGAARTAFERNALNATGVGCVVHFKKVNFMLCEFYLNF